MTFQAYIDNIHKKTGKTSDDFYTLAKKAKLLGSDLTASRFIAWMKKDFDLGHGHAMAIWAVFKTNGWVAAPASAPKKKASKSASKSRKTREGAK